MRRPQTHYATNCLHLQLGPCVDCIANLVDRDLQRELIGIRTFFPSTGSAKLLEQRKASTAVEAAIVGKCLDSLHLTRDCVAGIEKIDTVQIIDFQVSIVLATFIPVNLVKGTQDLIGSTIKSIYEQQSLQSHRAHGLPCRIR